MSVTTPITATAPAVRLVRSLPAATVAAGVVAAACTTALAAVAHAAGAPLAVGGEMIPLAGFAQMTLLGAVIGGVLLAVFNRRSVTPALRFLQTATALTALSCIPSVAWPPDGATKATLVALHLVAAAIIVPVLVRRAHD